MASRDNSDLLLNALRTIRGYNLEKVTRKNLGSEAFDEAETVVEKISAIGDRISPYILELDDTSVIELRKIITDLYTIFEEISNYDNGRFLAQRPTYSLNVSKLKEKAVGIWSKVIGLIHEIEKPKIDTADFEEQLSNFKNEASKDVNEIKVLRNRLVHEVEDFEKRYTETFQKAEINEQIGVFNNQAEKFFNNSKLWIGGISFCALVLVVIIIYIFKYFCFETVCFNKVPHVNYNAICNDCNRTILYLEIFKAVFFRLFIISFIIYLLNFCVKNYNASMHNYTINKHKANSLDASIRLLERLYSEKAKDEVLTNAANAIFSHQPTGYSNKDPENLQHSVMEKVIEKVDPTKTG